MDSNKNKHVHGSTISCIFNSIRLVAKCYPIAFKTPPTLGHLIRACTLYAWMCLSRCQTSAKWCITKRKCREIGQGLSFWNSVETVLIHHWGFVVPRVLVHCKDQQVAVMHPETQNEYEQKDEQKDEIFNFYQNIYQNGSAWILIKTQYQIRCMKFSRI